MNDESRLNSLIFAMPDNTAAAENPQAPVYHPNILLVRWEIAVRSRNWPAGLAIARALIAAMPSEPIGWIYHGFAQQQMGRVDEARRTLLVGARRFPNDWRIAFNLACYVAQLGDTNGAWNWIERAIEVGDAAVVQSCALNEQSLAPLWNRLGPQLDQAAGM